MFTTADLDRSRNSAVCLNPRSGNGASWASYDHAWCRRTLADLCAVDSTTGREAHLSSRLLRELTRLEPDSLCELPVVGERCNLLATWGTPRLLLSTHLDVVPAAGWKGAFTPSVDAQELTARGACDAKGQIVAQLAAIRRLIRLGLTDFAWLGVVDEERDSLGARSVASNPPAVLSEVEVVINGEPTGNVIASAQQGFERWSLECTSEVRHGACTEKRAAGAVSQLIGWLHRFESAGQQQAAHHSFFGLESYNISGLSAGEAHNIVAPVARSEVTLRTVPACATTDGEMLGEKSPVGLVAALEQARPAGAHLELQHRSAPLALSGWSDLVAAPVAFGSDAVHLIQLSRQGLVVMVGPGSIGSAHTDRESIQWTAFASGVDVLEALSRRVLAGELPSRLPGVPREVSGGSSRLNSRRFGARR